MKRLLLVAAALFLVWPLAVVAHHSFAAEFDARTWAQFFLKFILSHPAVTAVIPGTDKPQYMLDNLQAGRGPLPDAAMRKRMVQCWDSLS